MTQVKEVTHQRWSRAAIVVARAIVPHPSLWWTGLVALIRLSRRGWWHRPPFLPLPGEAYWHFRLVTAFGGTGDPKAMDPSAVVAYLRWCWGTRPHRG